LEERDTSIERRAGYHPGDFSYPRNDQQRFEVCVGAILTQNTSWKNARLALANLKKLNLLSIRNILNSDSDHLALAIKSAGYYNQKAIYLNNLARLFNESPFDALVKMPLEVCRKKLLCVKGIGPETADCVLLYALNKPSFVIDAYTNRIVSRLGIAGERQSYSQSRKLFEASLERDTRVYQEYHALLVKHGKTYYSRKPFGLRDTILTTSRLA
jgi:endonuclease-3 related protein